MPGQRTAFLIAPAAVSAVVIELTGATGVSMNKGQVLSHDDGTALRAVLIPDAPGDVRFTVFVNENGPTPRGTVVEVADAGGSVTPSTEAYRVAFGG